MAGIIVADTIQSGGSFIRLNSASQTVATINASGIYANTGNLLIAANGTIGVASITNTAITGTMTQAQIGTNVAGTGPAFRAYKSGSNQSVSTGVFTKLTFATVDFNVGSCYNTSTSVFTPTVAGYYSITAAVGTEGSTTLQRFLISVYKNGSSYGNWLSDSTFSSANQNHGFVIDGTDLIYMNGTSDYLEIYAYIAGTGLVAVTTHTRFSAFLARAA